jgi:hypothetical protein
MKVRLNKQRKRCTLSKKKKYSKSNISNKKLKSLRKKISLSRKRFVKKITFINKNKKSIKKINRKLKGGSCQPKIIYHPKSNPSGGVNNYNIIDGTTQVSKPVFPTYDMYVGNGIQYSKF